MISDSQNGTSQLEISQEYFDDHIKINTLDLYIWRLEEEFAGPREQSRPAHKLGIRVDNRRALKARSAHARHLTTPNLGHASRLAY